MRQSWASQGGCRRSWASAAQACSVVHTPGSGILSGWKSSRKEYTALGSRPDMFTFSTGDILLPLVVTIILLVSLKRSPSPLSSRPRRSSHSLGPPSRCLPATHSLQLSRWSTGYCRLFPALGVGGAHPPACLLPTAPQALTWLLERRATFTAVGGRYFKKRGLPGPRPGWRARREIWGVVGGGEGRGRGGYST